MGRALGPAPLAHDAVHAALWPTSRSMFASIMPSET